MRCKALTLRAGDFRMGRAVPSFDQLEGYARECIRLAGLTDDPQIKEQLILMAREWMNAALQAKRGAADLDEDHDKS